MRALRRGHATPRVVKYCAPGAVGLPAYYPLNLVLNLALNVVDLGKLVFRGSPLDSCCNQLYFKAQMPGISRRNCLPAQSLSLIHI